MMRIVARLYLAILRLFPRSFRKEHGDEVTRLFFSELDEGVGSGRFKVALLGLWDLFRELPRSHWRRIAGERPSFGDSRSFGSVDSFIQDLRYSWRSLVASPLFAAVIVLTLALGIGANTAIFSLYDAVLLKPFPLVPDQEELVVLANGDSFTFSHPDFRDLRDESAAFSALAATLRREMNLGTGSAAERVLGQLVSPGYFSALGVDAAKGRTFLPEEGRDPATHRVALISHRTWRARFGGEAEIVGREIRLNSHAYRIVGVMPRGFRGISLQPPPEVWAPDMMIGDFLPRMGAQTLDRRPLEALPGDRPSQANPQPRGSHLDGSIGCRIDPRKRSEHEARSETRPRSPGRDRFIEERCRGPVPETGLGTGRDRPVDRLSERGQSVARSQSVPAGSDGDPAGDGSGQIAFDQTAHGGSDLRFPGGGCGRNRPVAGTGTVLESPASSSRDRTGSRTRSTCAPLRIGSHVPHHLPGRPVAFNGGSEDPFGSNSE